ncbi:hypothetical protein AUJ77_01945 [Candidatus Nomurabacteria bacterium CG1_02_43_90]|uniref:Uncharacterized protein n=1 Tax=Candidatus Nomurabacteria bacterium CG1_02_43_90 TaxID=1805281 RepID=A0A1J4V054_9BACT|nr:MAG: hypothetical protein AUJ77_01945 [Candidatus Nomurabacteria bacterium CG1_02_43_90]
MEEGQGSSKVIFENDGLARPTQHIKISKMTAWIIRHTGGYIKDTQTVNYFLIFFIVLAIVFSFFIFVSSGEKKPLPPKIMDNSFVPRAQISYN